MPVQKLARQRPAQALVRRWSLLKSITLEFVPVILALGELGKGR